MDVEYTVTFGTELPELPSDITFFRLETPYVLYRNVGDAWEAINEFPNRAG